MVAQAWLGEIRPAPTHTSPATRSWPPVTLCPGNNISARKRQHGRTGTPAPTSSRCWSRPASATIRVRRLQARYAGWFAGSADKNPGAKKKATAAIAHTLLKITYQVLKSGTPYTEARRRLYPARITAAEAGLARRQLQKLRPGSTVTSPSPRRGLACRPAPDRQPLPAGPEAPPSPAPPAHPADEINVIASPSPPRRPGSLPRATGAQFRLSPRAIAAEEGRAYVLGL